MGDLHRAQARSYTKGRSEARLLRNRQARFAVVGACLQAMGDLHRAQARSYERLFRCEALEERAGAQRLLLL
jgi:hypothetical protein